MHVDCIFVFVLHIACACVVCEYVVVGKITAEQISAKLKEGHTEVHL